jgi:hypothetical protein
MEMKFRIEDKRVINSEVFPQKPASNPAWRK